MKLELGGGTLCPPDSTNLDPVHGEGDWKRRAQDTPWPAPDNSVDAIRASHVLEHIPAGDERIAVFNEAHRVLAPGGLFTIILPLVGYTDPETGEGRLVARWEPYSDPDHKGWWWFPESLYYFTGRFKANADYGIREWVMGEWNVLDGWEGTAVLQKP